MLSENLKTIRKSKGFSQEEMASRINVVRQTVSKWEKGLSVPDAEVLIKIADLFEVSVHELLGAKLDSSRDVNEIAEQLSRINEQLCYKNHRSRLIWKVVIGILIAFVAFNIILMILNMVSFNEYDNKHITTEIGIPKIVPVE